MKQLWALSLAALTLTASASAQPANSREALLRELSEFRQNASHYNRMFPTAGLGSTEQLLTLLRG